MNLATRRHFERTYQPVADAIARLDLDQEVREQVATGIADTLAVDGTFPRELFTLLATDPLVKCGGPDGNGCPHGRETRVAMHDSTADDGRSFAWADRAPLANCVSCGPVAR